MSDDLHQLIQGLERRPMAKDAAIAASEELLKTKLPSDYVRFLKLTDGGEGFIGKNAYVMLWPVEELASLNLAYEVQKYAPGLLIFGSDGGGEAYGFDTRNPNWPIIAMPFVGMDWDLARPLSDTFSRFLQSLYEST